MASEFELKRRGMVAYYKSISEQKPFWEDLPTFENSIVVQDPGTKTQYVLMRDCDGANHAIYKLDRTGQLRSVMDLPKHMREAVKSGSFGVEYGYPRKNDTEEAIQEE